MHAEILTMKVFCYSKTGFNTVEAIKGHKKA